MFKVLITTTYKGTVSTVIVECDSDKEADKAVKHIMSNKTFNGVYRFAERLN